MKTLEISDEAYHKLLGLKNYVTYKIWPERTVAEAKRIIQETGIREGVVDPYKIALKGEIDFDPTETMSDFIPKIVDAVVWSNEHREPISIT
ncbi:unnamed protein product [marine sediment metagenome]|uniref:Uncharacterized protein n=1 Tax=marine sediment metagenome TaxID=412755 RepID=X1Q9D5_9ZZZZ